jgi:hypothetical protein
LVASALAWALSGVDWLTPLALVPVGEAMLDPAGSIVSEAEAGSPAAMAPEVLAEASEPASPADAASALVAAASSTAGAVSASRLQAASVSTDAAAARVMILFK